jgi:hypothetical protein
MNCHPRESIDWDLFASGGSLLVCAWPGRLPHHTSHLAGHSRADRTERRVQTQVGRAVERERTSCMQHPTLPPRLYSRSEERWLGRSTPLWPA